VIQAAVCDILIAVGGMSVLHIPMEPASIGALLMLIGYSVDTDIMLTSRTLKDKSGRFDEQVDDAVKTGLTMTATTLTALSLIYVVSVTLTQIPIWSNIAIVLIIGLLADIPSTWLTNAGIIKWYVKSGGRKIRFFGRRIGLKRLSTGRSSSPSSASCCP
jgi:preprotein translocase subunit SecF